MDSDQIDVKETELNEAELFLLQNFEILEKIEDINNKIKYSLDQDLRKNWIK